MLSLVVPSLLSSLCASPFHFIPPSLLLLLELKYSVLITRPKILPQMKATLWQIYNMQIDY